MTAKSTIERSSVNVLTTSQPQEADLQVPVDARPKKLHIASYARVIEIKILNAEFCQRHNASQGCRMFCHRNHYKLHCYTAISLSFGNTQDPAI